MGIYLNPGAEALREGRRQKIYVDKSGMIAYLNSVARTKQKYVCVSRPRRFGKTMAAEMVCAYYDRTVDGAAEFAGLEIASDPSFEENRNAFDVLHVNMQEFLSATHDAGKLVERLNARLAHEVTLAYPDLDFFDKSSLVDVMADVHSQTNTQFVIVIDEWDCVMREMERDKEGQDAYLDFLRAWLKDRPFVALCYMTGILPIKKYGTHSALNMFSEFSMLEPDQLAEYVGFTEEEVRSLCAEHGLDFEVCRAWYDGYRLEGAKGQRFEVYAPRSVVSACDRGRFGSYWNRTETFEALRRYIVLDMDGLHSKVVELVAGGRVLIGTGTYVNDMTTLNCADDVLTLLVHLGYLGFEPYGEGDQGHVFVPNREVLGEFENSVKDRGWDEVARSIRESEALLDALVAGDAEAVAEGVQKAHEDVSSIISYNNEADLAATLRLAFFSCVRRWRLVREAPAGKGYADLTLIPLASKPDVPGIVIELKYDATAAEALAQIRERGYDRALDGLAAQGRVILCGIAYDPATKTHSCLIEQA